MNTNFHPQTGADFLSRNETFGEETDAQAADGNWDAPQPPAILAPKRSTKNEKEKYYKTIRSGSVNANGSPKWANSEESKKRFIRLMD